jgi:monoamine oxidase
VKRREALQHLGWGLSGSVLMPSILQACAPKDPGPELNYAGTVAIVGAGAAGLYVADILRSKGVKVIIFEARDQIGGRIKSLRNQSETKYPNAAMMSSDFPLELGAQTIIGSDSIFGKIFQAYNLAVAEYPTSSNAYVLSNFPKTESDWNGDADFIAAKNFITNLRSNAGSSQTSQQAIAGAGIHDRAFGMLNGAIANAYGSDIASLGIGAIAEGLKLNTTDGKIIGLVSNPMQDTLISRFSAVQEFVRLSTPIASINYNANPIVLTAKDGTTFQADKVVVTVPVSMLKSNAIAFTPGLPGAMTSSLSKIGMGGCMRMVVEFKKNFWGDTISFIQGSANVPEYFSAGVGRGQFNRTMSITVNGAKAAQYADMTDEAVLDAVIADVDLLYPGLGTQFVRYDVNDPTKRLFIRENWSKAEYIQGGYSYPLAGARNDDRKAIGQPVNDVLYFAGEATDVSGQAGMVNGALASAERVAQEIVEGIKKGV